MKDKFVIAFMKVAHTFAELSSARRLKVGAIIVKDERIISIGYNGMPAGWDNNCEDEIRDDSNVVSIHPTALKTKPEVLHAESNAIAKLAKSTDSGNDAAMFITHAPCLDCAKLIYQSGITRLFYSTDYRNSDGIEFLEKCNIEIEKVYYETYENDSI